MHTWSFSFLKQSITHSSIERWNKIGLPPLPAFADAVLLLLARCLHWHWKCSLRYFSSVAALPTHASPCVLTWEIPREISAEVTASASLKGASLAGVSPTHPSPPGSPAVSGSSIGDLNCIMPLLQATPAHAPEKKNIYKASFEYKSEFPLFSISVRKIEYKKYGDDC